MWVEKSGGSFELLDRENPGEDKEWFNLSTVFFLSSVSVLPTCQAVSVAISKFLVLPPMRLVFVAVG